MSVVACGGDSDSTSTGKTAASERDAGALPKVVSGGEAQGDAKAAKIEVELPDDLPVYPGASFVEASEGVAGGVSLTLETADPASEVTRRMSSLLREAGWEIQRSDRAAASAIFADKGNRSLSLLIDRQNDATRISMLVLVLE